MRRATGTGVDRSGRHPQPSSPDRVEPPVLDRWATLPNLLSVARLVMVPVFVLLLARGQDPAALAVLAVSGVTDYLDGWIARRWNQVSRLGQALDPLADRLCIVATLVGLAAHAVIPWWLVGALVARDALLTLNVALRALRGRPPQPVSLLGKIATFLLLHSFPLLLLGRVWPAGAVVALPLGWACAGWGAALYWWTAVGYLSQWRDPLPRRGLRR